MRYEGVGRNRKRAFNLCRWCGDVGLLVEVLGKLAGEKFNGCIVGKLAR